MIIKQNYNVSQLSWIHIGGKAKYYLELYNNNDIMDAINYCSENNLRYRFIGRGCNIYFGEYFDGAILKMCLDPDDTNLIDIFKKYNTDYTDNKNDEYYIVIPAHLNLMTIIYYLAKYNFDLSNMYGIPGSIGGAVINNAGAYGSEISDYLSEVVCLNIKGSKKYTKEEMQYTYRNSILKNNFEDILVTVFLKVTKTKLSENEIINKCNKIYDTRKSKFPVENNLGSAYESYFCNDGKIPVGALLDKINSKKLKFNNICIHDKHANVIVNHKKDNDIESMDNLINEIDNLIFLRYGIKLNIEIRKII